MISRAQVKMARAALGWGVKTLGEKVGVATNTISRYENGYDAYGETLRKIQRVFEDAGITFIEGKDGAEGVMVKKKDTLQ